MFPKQPIVVPGIVPKRVSACIEPKLFITKRPPIGDEVSKQEQAIVLLSQWTVRAAIRIESIRAPATLRSYQLLNPP